jgi:hypothetical protein
MIPDIEVYKIFDPNTRLFSKGGLDAKRDGYKLAWSKKGKLWPSAGAIRSHLGQFIQEQWVKTVGHTYEMTIPKHWVVVKTFTENGVLKQEQFNAIDFYLQSKDTNYAKFLKQSENQDD